MNDRSGICIESLWDRQQRRWAIAPSRSGRIQPEGGPGLTGISESRCCRDAGIAAQSRGDSCLAAPPADGEAGGDGGGSSGEPGGTGELVRGGALGTDPWHDRALALRGFPGRGSIPACRRPSEALSRGHPGGEFPRGRAGQARVQPPPRAGRGRPGNGTGGSRENSRMGGNGCGGLCGFRTFIWRPPRWGWGPSGPRLRWSRPGRWRTCWDCPPLANASGSSIWDGRGIPPTGRRANALRSRVESPGSDGTSAQRIPVLGGDGIPHARRAGGNHCPLCSRAAHDLCRRPDPPALDGRGVPASPGSCWGCSG